MLSNPICFQIAASFFSNHTFVGRVERTSCKWIFSAFEPFFQLIINNSTFSDEMTFFCKKKTKQTILMLSIATNAKHWLSNIAPLWLHHLHNKYRQLGKLSIDFHFIFFMWWILMIRIRSISCVLFFPLFRRNDCCTVHVELFSEIILWIEQKICKSVTFPKSNGMECVM